MRLPVAAAAVWGLSTETGSAMTSPSTKVRPPRARVAEGVPGLPKPARRRRPLLVVVGLVVASLAAALVAALLGAATATTLVWATAAEVQRGQVVQPGDLAAVEVNESTVDSLLPASVESRGRLLGRVWAADLPAGQLLSDALTSERLPVGDGQALVGLRLGPGAFPAAGLRPGDVVMVIATSAQQGAAPRVLVERAVIESVAELGEQGVASDRLVTLSVPAAAAAAVADAGSAGRASLAVVAS
jgi:hypothetical protein